MKSIISILALLCTVYVSIASEQDLIDPPGNLERLVNIQKTATEAILNGLLLLEKQTKLNLETRLNELKTEALVNIHNAINEALENVNLSVNKGRKEGKKVDDCYYYARNNLETKNTNAIADLETCVQNGNTAMENPLANVASSIEAAKKLLTDLDAIIPNCYSPSFLKMQACVIKNLVLSRVSLKRISNNAKAVATTTGVVYAKTIIDVRSCTTTNVANIRTFSTNIIIRNEDCIRNASKE